MTTLASAGEPSDFGRTYWRSLRTATGDLPALSSDAMDDATFRLIADNIPTLCWVANGDGYIVWYNRRWHEYCGTTREQMEGWGWTAVHDPQRLPSVMERWTNSIASGEPFEMTFPLRGADGAFRPFLTRVQPIRDEEGAIARWVGMNTEISDQISAEEALRTERDRSRGVLDSMAEAFVLLDREFRVLDINAEGMKFELRPPKAIVGHVHWDVWPGTEQTELGQLYKRAMVDRVPFTFEHLYVWPDGRAVWFEVRGYPTVDGLALFYRDVTERRRAAQALEENAARFRDMADQAPVIAWVTDATGHCTYLSRRWYEFTGQALGTGEGYGWLDAVHPDDRTNAEEAFATANAERRDYRVEFRVRCADGSFKWVIDTAAARFSLDGEYIGFVGSVIDIDERRQAEFALQASTLRAEALSAQQAAILGQLAEGVVVTDPEGRITFVNEAAKRIHGVARLDVEPDEYSESYHLLMLDGEPYPSKELPLSRAVLNQETVSEARWRVARPDGTQILAIGSAGPVLDDRGELLGAVLTVRDDTQRDAAERALRDSRDQLADESRALEILNQTGTQIAGELSLDDLVQKVVDAGVKLTGARFGAFFYNVLDEAGASYMLFALSGAERNAFEGFGMPRATSVFAPTFRGEGVIRSDDILVDARYGKNAPHSGMPTGHPPVRSYLAVPVKSRSGDVLGGLFFGHEDRGVFTERSERVMTGLAAQAAIGIDNARLFDAVQRANLDLEERVRERTAELEQAHEALRQSQKMEAVGQLTGGIAHDFNNLLAGISGSLEAMERRVGEQRYHDLSRYIEGAQGAARRAASLTQRLLAFSRRQTLDPKPTDVNRLIHGMEDLIRRSLGPDITLEVVGAGGLWTAHIDPSQLENALLNLCINGRDAMPGGGRLTIETANKWLDAREAKTRDLPPGQYLSLCVTDTGTGIPKSVIDRVFDPFFTTKPIGQGTGLGLSMIYGFVRQSGGQVRIYSEEGHGTTMCLYLPRFTGAVAEQETKAEEAIAVGDGEVVVVIDDEPLIRMLVVEALEENGYQVVDAGDGPSGLKVLETAPRVDLLITDVGLPGGMNGRQVADAARVQRPDLKVLFLTGYAENAVVGNGHLDPGMEVMTKPFVHAEFINKVRELIAGL